MMEKLDSYVESKSDNIITPLKDIVEQKGSDCPVPTHAPNDGSEKDGCDHVSSKQETSDKSRVKKKRFSNKTSLKRKRAVGSDHTHIPTKQMNSRITEENQLSNSDDEVDQNGISHIDFGNTNSFVSEIVKNHYTTLKEGIAFTNDKLPNDDDTERIPALSNENGSNEIDNNSDGADSNVKHNNAFICGVCGKEYRHKQTLSIHMRSHTEGPVYNCYICESSFFKSGNLARHIKIVHKGDRPHKCFICEKAFGQRSDLDKHILIVHRQDKPYPCNVCDKSFSRRTHLKRHVEVVHLGNRPHKCPICDKQFGAKGDAKTHLRLIHKIVKTYDCDQCRSVFDTEEKLIEHKTADHGDDD